VVGFVTLGCFSDYLDSRRCESKEIVFSPGLLVVPKYRFSSVAFVSTSLFYLLVSVAFMQVQDANTGAYARQPNLQGFFRSVLIGQCGVLNIIKILAASHLRFNLGFLRLFCTHPLARPPSLHPRFLTIH
jgi:hypothetical protein